MRVCTPSCGIRPESTSGGEVYEREFLWHSAETFRHHIILAKHQPIHAHPAWEVSRFPIGRGLRWWVAAGIVPHTLIRLARRWPMNVIRAHSVYGMGLACLRVGRHLNVPVIAHHHHLDPGWHTRVCRWVLNRVDAVIVGSEFSRQQLAAADIRTDHVSVIPYGVSPAFFPPRRPRRWTRPRVLWVGTKTRKGLEAFLAAWHAHPPEADLWVMGQGRSEPGISYLGYVMERDKPIVYRCVDVFVTGSVLEGFGLAAAEALSSDVPVVCFRAGSLPEVVGRAGLLVSHGDYVALVEAVSYLVQDREERERLAAHARRWPWAEHVRGVETVYERVGHS